ncbi:hypothetical protein BH09MYX1_BH09MYX1_43160 [soil metagenome]
MTEAGDDYMRIMAARSRRRRRIAVRVLGVLAFGALLVWGPGWMIERARESYGSCSNADYDEAPNPKTDCTGGKTWLLFPKIVPWKRGEALKESRTIDRLAAGRALTMATVVVCDEDAQARAIAKLARMRTDPDQALAADAFSSILSVDGAAWRIGAERSTLDSAFSQNRFLEATVQHGPLDDAIAFARTPPPVLVEDYDSRDLFFRRGALLCLAGRETEGRAAFHEAIRVNAKFHPFPFAEARVGLAACGEVLESRSEDSDHSALLSYQIGTRLAGATLDTEILGSPLAIHTYSHSDTVPFVAAAIVERDRPVDATLKILGGLTPLSGSSISPWPWSTIDQTAPLLDDPVSDETAAEKLEALAKTARESTTPIDAELLYALPFDVSVRERYAKIMATPAATLREASRRFWLEAAVARARMGQCDRSETDGRRVLSMGATGEERLYVAAAWLRCGHFEAAGEIATEALGEPLLRALLFASIRVQALAHAGKLDEALTLAKGTATRAAGIQRSSDPIAQLFDDGVGVAAGIDWLVLALALHKGDSSGAPSIEVSAMLGSEKTNWRDLIARPEAQRAAFRFVMADVSGSAHSSARPAELFVIGKATDGNAEVWLDKTSRSGLGPAIPAMRARAEAARWRGDAKAEADWLARATAAEKLITDGRKLTLAKLAGL